MAQAQLPENFCVYTVFQRRAGYAFFTAYREAHNQAIRYRLVKRRHENLRYDIIENPATPQNNVFHHTNIVKQQGNSVRNVNWRTTNKVLRRGTFNLPVLIVSPMSALTTHNRDNFVPIIDSANPPAQPAPAPAPAPVRNGVIPMYKIPAHALRALLEHALIHEHLCPILDIPIDVGNGAVTSCFHIFEKSAIKKWLETPSSQQKCPVCNQPCNSYCLEDETRTPSPIDLTNA